MLRKLLISILPIAAIALLTSEQMSDNGKAGRTGSPNELFCTDCHNSYALNSGGGFITISSPGTPAFKYTPGQTYNMTVTVARSANNLFGVGIEALTSTNINAGTLNITDAASTGIKSVLISGVTRRNLVHKLNGGANPGTKDFNFSWTAPAAGTGNVIFYFAGVAANGNGNENLDYVYASNQVFTEDVATCSGPPVQPGVITGNTTVCSGSSVTYTVPVVPDAASYTWTFPTGWTGTSTSNSITLTAGSTPGNVTVTADNTCGSSPASSVAISINNPTASITSAGDTLYASLGNSYEWYLNGNFITGVTNSYYVPTQNGIYVVVVYDATGCIATSPEFTYTSVGIDAVVQKDAIDVYPNPASNWVYINSKSVLNTRLTIYDAKGQVVMVYVLNKSNNKIDVSTLSEGVYTLITTDKNNKNITRLLVTK